MGACLEMLPSTGPLAHPHRMAAPPASHVPDATTALACAQINGLRQALRLPSSVRVHGVFWSHDPLSHLLDRLPPALAAAYPKRQRDYLLGRHCAASALADAGYPGPAWLPAGQDKLPVWPTGWLGSISHAGRGAVAAVAREDSCELLGIDMEGLIERSMAADISHLVASRDELELMQGLGIERGLALLFSAKEALYKALFPKVRQFFDFTAAQAVALDDRLVLRLTVDWAPWPKGTLMPVRYAFREAHVFTAVHA
jgi:enterobactin synthetase component D